MILKILVDKVDVYMIRNGTVDIDITGEARQ